jgi:hypothetical protein
MSSLLEGEGIREQKTNCPHETSIRREQITDIPIHHEAGLD